MKGGSQRSIFWKEKGKVRNEFVCASFSVFVRESVCGCERACVCVCVWECKCVKQREIVCVGACGMGGEEKTKGHKLSNCLKGGSSQWSR